MQHIKCKPFLPTLLGFLFLLSAQVNGQGIRSKMPERFTPDNSVILLVDHQTGLISLVQDFSPNEFKNNVLALGDVALRGRANREELLEFCYWYKGEGFGELERRRSILIDEGRIG